MAQQLSKTGIASLGTIKPGHVSQSIDAFTGIEAYDIFLSGSFNITGSINGEPGVVNQLTASYATSASYAVSSTSASYAGNSTTSSYSVTSSYSNTSTSASYAVSSSHSLTSSYSGDAISSSYALTASYIENAQTASYVENAQTASFITASNVYGPYGSSSVISSSYALSASYVEGSIGDLGLSPLTVVVATTTQLPNSPVYDNGPLNDGIDSFLSGSSNGSLGNIDGVSLAVNDRILVKNQTPQLRNGVYKVTQTGSISVPYILTRTLDSDETSEFDPQVVIPSSGSINKGLLFSQQTNEPTVGTSSIVYSQITTNTYVTQQPGAQVTFNIPWWTSSTRQLSRGTNKFQLITTTPDPTLRLTGSLAVSGSITGSSGVVNNLTASYAITASHTPELVGTQHYVPKFDFGYGLTNSQIYDNGANVLIGIVGSTGDKVQIYNFTDGYTALRVNQTKVGNILTLQTGSREIFKVESSGLTSLTGSLNVSGSTSFVGTHTLSGSNTITGTTVLSGSIDVSGSSNFHNTIFIVTGSQFFTGSSHFIGNQDITGSLKITGSGEGSGFYIDGNKQFNYAVYAHTASISGSANVSQSFSFNSPDGSSGISLVSGSRITFSHSGVYNIQYSAQLYTQTGATVHIWFKETGSNIPETGTRIGPTTNGDYLAPSRNFVRYYPSGSYVELAWQSDQSNTQFPYIAATGNIPSCPAIMVEVTQVR